MEAIEEKKKTGNPNFGKKKEVTNSTNLDPKARYRFQLVQTHEKVKPRDRETGEMLENPYPPYYMIPNAGVAFDKEKNEQRRWRYVYGYPSIWEDEQLKPEPSKQQLSSERNDLVFKQGFMTVNGSDKAKMMALMVQDVFEGNENPIEDRPKVYRLLDENKELNKIKTEIDSAYEAETAARNATLEEMLPIASVFGIDVSNYEENADKIRTAFILRAKSAPAAFLKQFVDPRNKILYTFRQALIQNIIKQREGSVLMVDTDREIYRINPDKDVAEQSTNLLLQGDERVNKAYEQVARLLA